MLKQKDKLATPQWLNSPAPRPISASSPVEYGGLESRADVHEVSSAALKPRRDTSDQPANMMMAYE